MEVFEKKKKRKGGRREEEGRRRRERREKERDREYTPPPPNINLGMSAVWVKGWRGNIAKRFGFDYYVPVIFRVFSRYGRDRDFG